MAGFELAVAKTIIENIKKYRINLMSQAELARRSGLTQAAINKIDKLDSFPSILSIVKMCKAMDVSIDDMEEDNFSLPKEKDKLYSDFKDIILLNDKDRYLVGCLVRRLLNG